MIPVLVKRSSLDIKEDSHTSLSVAFLPAAWDSCVGLLDILSLYSTVP